ncbi:hypothetical protein LJ739_07295 [Aestuariibacter halophilus]|uniref:histidine kinase n=1 Tax=Fluctibacter halophilus TaxID=226011 RepID=A0ABS8G7I7_9ALTE|nr:ATP-binding protein [Aestuariibacter halophilus]MCC2616041.1 hypothetical protein [Aestuariibacter halophilus]
MFVLLFQLIAYACLQMFNAVEYKTALYRFKDNELRASFTNSISNIDNLVELMEQKATDIALVGEALHQMRVNDDLPIATVTSYAKNQLLRYFESFPQAIGGGLWYEPFTMDPNQRWFGPYVFREGSEVTFTWDLNTPAYDYLNQPWYRMAPDNQWGKNQTRYRPVFWTSPYRDDAATFSLMMTVDAVMLDTQGAPLGMATVDWSLDEMTRFLEDVKVSHDATPFLIHIPSERVLSYPLAESGILLSADALPWLAPLLKLEGHQFGRLPEPIIIDAKEKPQYVFYQVTEHGFLIGTLLPSDFVQAEVDRVTWLTAAGAIAMAILFLFLMLGLFRWLFSPFDHLVSTLHGSIAYSDDDKVVLSKVHYDKNNEFRPVVDALNDIYAQIQQHVTELERSNDRLRAAQQEVQGLNLALEEKVARRTAELEQKTHQVMTSLDTLKRTQQQLVETEKHAALGRLVAGVAHQINTPLGICVTAASTLESTMDVIYQKINQGKLSRSVFQDAYDKVLQSAEMINQNLARATQLIGSFKQVAVDSDDDNKRTFDLVRYFEDMLLSLRSRTHGTPHKIVFSCKDAISLYASPAAFTQITTQLVDNALKHAFEPDHAGTMRIDLHVKGETLVMLFSDDGKGMTPSVRAQIFDPFFTTLEDKFGSGLGMHIIYNQVVHQLGGNIECDSQLGEGTRFVISLPIVKKAPQETRS